MSYTLPEFLAHAVEEREHARSLDDWIARMPRPSMTWDEDPEALEPID
jgi:hypothetical protein